MSRLRIRPSTLVWSAAVLLLLGAVSLFWIQSPGSKETKVDFLGELTARTGNYTTKDVLGRLVLEQLAKAKASPSSPEPVSRLARLFQANNQNELAEKCWRRVLELQPKNAQACYLLSFLRRTAGDYEESTQLLRRTAELSPEYAPVWLQLAGIAFKTGKSAEAETYYRKRLKLLPNDPYAGAGLARILLQNGDTPAARKLMEQTVKDYPKFPTGHILLGEILASAGEAEAATRERNMGRAVGRFRDAEDPWVDDLRWDCHDYERLRTLATIEFQTERSEIGARLIKHAVELNPGNPAGYELLAKLSLKNGDIETARAAYEDCIAKTTDGAPDSLVFAGLADLYRTLKRPDKVLSTVEGGLKKHPDSYVLWDALGKALGDAAKYSESIAAFQKAIELNPKDGNAHFNLALAYLKAGNEKEAEVKMKQALEVHPGFVPALTLLGQHALQQGKLDEAERYLKPLAELNPNNLDALKMLARVHADRAKQAEAAGDRTLALNEIRLAHQTNPGDAETVFHLGEMLLAASEFSEAKNLLAPFHEAHRENLEVTLLLSQALARSGDFEGARTNLLEARALAKAKGNTEVVQFCDEILPRLPQKP